EKRARQLVAKGREALRGARALRAGVPTAAARAEVHRRDELEARGEERPPACSRDADRSVLERLAKRLERGSLELRHLVQEEHAPMRKARLARTRTRPTADDGRGRRAV